MMESVRHRQAYHHEWLLTNGLGGYATSLGNLLNERKYSGLLVAGLENYQRVHVLSNLEELVEYQGQIVHLDANHYPDCIFPEGYTNLVKSWIRPHISLLYSSDPIDDNFLILKEVFMIPGQNGVVIKYHNLGRSPLSLNLRPKFSLRDHHTLNQPGCWDSLVVERYAVNRSFSLIRSDNGLMAGGFVENGLLLDHPVIYRNVFYPYEAARGFEAVEDLYSPVEVRFSLAPEETNRLVIYLNDLTEPLEAAGAAEEYYLNHPLPADHPRKLDRTTNWLSQIRFNKTVFSHAEYLEILTLAARDFVVNDELVAGYPWYGPHSRDALIGLGAARLLKGGPALARRMLKNLGRTLSHGRLPRETVGEPAGRDYELADAPLWFVIRCWEYGPKDRELLRRCNEVVLNYLHNNRMPFVIDQDGLIKTRDQAMALTWMDASVGGRSITPRGGKTVELNALWYNALRCLEAMAEAQGIKDDQNLVCLKLKIRLSELKNLAKRVKKSLQAFDRPGYPADRIDGRNLVTEIRPNAIIALSLPFDWLPVESMKQAFERAKEELLTAKGLRTLAPGSPGFKRKYVGNERQRNLAMHQGAVWPWLLAPMFRLAAKLNAGRQDWREFFQEASSLIWRFRSGFIRNHVATLPEIYDGLDPSFPKGCPASAPAVLALLEIEMMLQELGESQ